ncbi:MAG: M42 family metallopeptidase [Candidatus Omnitrophica bacterium]|nr:M42 family metallopeptidase [Candidatus Omnitrophota bacterium]
MEKKSLEFLKRLMETVSPSGFEEEAVRIWKERTKGFADEVRNDVHGNSIAVLNKGGKPRIMLAGHIDEIGYMVKYIDKQGYIYFSTIGGIDLHLVPGQRVWIKTKKGKVLGVIGRKPAHLLEGEERKKISKIEELWIDIGAKDEKEAKSILDIGDPAVPAVGFENLRNDLVVARGFDDKGGAFIVSETLRLLSEKKIKSAVYGVATVQEEIGLRGARTSAYGISPDIGIAIDVTFASDFPTMDKKKIGDIRIGGGPVIARGPNINPKIFELLVETAKKEKISYQIEGISKATGTDANVIQLTKSGVATGLVSIPNRYMHTPVELVNLQDLENIAKLLSAFILRIGSKISL